MLPSNIRVVVQTFVNEGEGVRLLVGWDGGATFPRALVGLSRGSEMVAPDDPTALMGSGPRCRKLQRVGQLEIGRAWLMTIPSCRVSDLCSCE